MGTDTIPLRTGGQSIQDGFFDLIRAVLIGDIVPRNSSAVATTLSGALGTAAFKWLRAYIKSGYWACGDIKMHHSYNGAAGPGQGWMLCSNRIISQGNYDTEHGAGSWAQYIGSSPLEGKYLPTMSNRFPVGKDATTETGVGASPASVGNFFHTVDLTHLHTWYNYISGAPDQSYDAAGSGTNFAGGGVDKTTGAKSLFITNFAGGADVIAAPGIDYETQDLGTLVETDHKPDSIETQFYMRII